MIPYPKVSVLRQETTIQRDRTLTKLDQVIAAVASRGRLPRLAIAYGKLLVIRDLLAVMPVESLHHVNVQFTAALEEVAAVIEPGMGLTPIKP